MRDHLLRLAKALAFCAAVLVLYLAFRFYVLPSMGETH